MTRLEIMQAISERFNYDAYVAVCEANNLTAQQRSNWAQLMGMMSAAETMYPGVNIDKAYTDFINVCAEESAVLLEEQVKRIREIPENPNGCGSCGGGKVR